MKKTRQVVVKEKEGKRDIKAVSGSMVTYVNSQFVIKSKEYETIEAIATVHVELDAWSERNYGMLISGIKNAIKRAEIFLETLDKGKRGEFETVTQQQLKLLKGPKK